MTLLCASYKTLYTPQEGVAYSCVEAQYEDLSDTPCSLVLPEKALMVVGPTEKGDSMATLDICCQIVRDKGVDRNKTWKTPRFATLPGNSKLFFIFDTTVEAEEELIQVRRVIQEQFLGHQDAGASAILIHPATLQARGIDTSVLRSYSTGTTNEEAQLRSMKVSLGFKHADIKPNHSFGEEVAAFATQNQQATTKEETDKIAHKDKENAEALEQQTRESKKIDEDKAVQEKKKEFNIKVHKEKIQAIDDGIKTSQKLLDDVQAYGSVTILDADDLETIRQCELSITDFQRQKDVCLAVMNAQSPAVIYNEVPKEVAVEDCAPPPTTRDKDQHKKIPVRVKRRLDEPDMKSIPLTFLKPSNMVWAALSLTTSKVETCGVAFEMTADAQADSSVNFQILLDGLPISVTVPGQTGMPKPDSLEIGFHKI